MVDRGRLSDHRPGAAGNDRAAGRLFGQRRGGERDRPDRAAAGQYAEPVLAPQAGPSGGARRRVGRSRLGGVFSRAPWGGIWNPSESAPRPTRSTTASGAARSRRRGAALRILCMPQAFKGSLSAHEAARAMARGCRAALPQAEAVALPMADGGDRHPRTCWWARPAGSTSRRKSAGRLAPRHGRGGGPWAGGGTAVRGDGAGVGPAPA